MARRSQDKVPFKLCSQPLSFFSSVSNMNNDQEKLRHTALCHLVISFSLLISPIIPTVQLVQTYTNERTQARSERLYIPLCIQTKLGSSRQCVYLTLGFKPTVSTKQITTTTAMQMLISVLSRECCLSLHPSSCRSTLHEPKMSMASMPSCSLVLWLQFGDTDLYGTESREQSRKNNKLFTCTFFYIETLLSLNSK